MSKTNRNAVRIPRNVHFDFLRDEDLELHPELVPAPAREPATGAEARVLLDLIVRAHRWQLVATARRHLGKRYRDHAEDMVQSLCLDVLEGRFTVSADRDEALDDLMREVIERCDGGP